ncbi:MAG: ABC transporter [Maricaulis sp.]|nr:ABC transporter [Oceanicaulis sp.]MAZ91073.1 ABC transporter [Maricaulis sp.]|tara:strand:- start:110 stop:388 length:279 start_codon:yes stop_codon:yes gene_type:complete
MPRLNVAENSRMSFRVDREDKALLMRAAALQNTDLTAFVLTTAMREARAAIEAAETERLSARDSQAVLDLLENPPEPNKRLMAAAFAMPDKS